MNNKRLKNVVALLEFILLGIFIYIAYDFFPTFVKYEQAKQFLIGACIINNTMIGMMNNSSNYVPVSWNGSIPYSPNAT